MHKGRTALVFKPIAMGFHSIFVVDFKPLPAPPVIQLPFIVHHPRDVLEHAVQRTGKGQPAEVGQAFLNEWRADHGQGLLPLSVRDVFAFKQEKRESKDMVPVNMGDEHRPQASNIVTCAAKPSQGRGGASMMLCPSKSAKE